MYTSMCYECILFMVNAMKISITYLLMICFSILKSETVAIFLPVLYFATTSVMH